MAAAELLWATDVHLDHLGHPAASEQFGLHLRRENPRASGLLVTGDIGEAPSVVEILESLARGFDGPLYFVLGNHDYYRGHFRTVDHRVRDACSRHPSLLWLREGPHLLTQGVALLGNGGFYDARNGNPESPLKLSDFMLIGEIFEALEEGRAKMHALLRARADELAHQLKSQALALLAKGNISHAIVATHVPPFVEASWHEGRTSDATWAPYFSSRATGDALVDIARTHPRVRFTVLCGHTHGAGVYRAEENLVVYTGRARYGAPDLAGKIHYVSGNPASFEVHHLRS